MNDFFYKKLDAFQEISYASIIEVLCQLDIAQSVGYISDNELLQLEDKASHLTRVMSGLRKSLSDKLQEQEYSPSTFHL